MPDAISDPTFAAQTKAAFSSNPVQDFDEEDEFRSGRAADTEPRYPQDRDDDYALLQQSEADDLGASSHHAPTVQGAYDPTAHPPGAVMHDYDTSYGGAYGQHYHHQQSESYNGDNTYGSGGSGHGQWKFEKPQVFVYSHDLDAIFLLVGQFFWVLFLVSAGFLWVWDFLF